MTSSALRLITILAPWLLVTVWQFSNRTSESKLASIFDWLHAALHRTTDVERTHGQLGTGLADRLSRDDADGFADIDVGPTCQIAAVARAADADPRLAGQHRADLDRFDGTFLVDSSGNLLVNDRSRRSQDIAGGQVDHVLGGRTAENTLAQRRDDDAALNHRRDGDAVGGAAVLLEDDAVLGHIDQTRVR